MEQIFKTIAITKVCDTQYTVDVIGPSQFPGTNLTNHIKTGTVVGRPHQGIRLYLSCYLLWWEVQDDWVHTNAVPHIRYEGRMDTN